MENELIYERSQLINTSVADRWGRLRPSSMLAMLQEAAGEQCHLLGLGGDYLAPKGLFWAIIRQSVQINRLPVIGETLTVQTWPGETTKVAYPRYYVGRNQRREELFRGVALWLLMDRKTRAMVLPGKGGVLVPGIHLEGELPMPRSIAPANLPQHIQRQVRYTQLDTNGHMSNTKYLDWMEDLLPAQFHKERQLASVQISYLAEALEGQKIDLQWGISPDGLLALEGSRPAENDADRIFALKALYRKL
jgi:medium-chain acyl-[acyl-carrier-protein] hydrolase